MDLFGAVAFYSSFFSDDKEFAPKISGTDDVLIVVETDGQLKGRVAVGTKRLVPPTEGTSMTFLKMSTVGIEVGKCWNRLLMMVILMFNRKSY